MTSPTPTTNATAVPDELHVMLLAWNARSPQARAVALDIADRNRRAALASVTAGIDLNRALQEERR